MRRGLLVATAVVLALSACGGDDDDNAETLPSQTPTSVDSPETTETAEPAAEPTDEELATKLLTVADMPPGYSISTDEDDDESDAAEACEEATGTFDELDGATAEVQFQKGEVSIVGGAVVLESLTATDDAEDLERRFDALPEIVDKCREFTTTDEDGSTFTGTFSPLSFDKVGDQTFAMHISANASSEGIDFPVAGDFVFVREDGTVMAVASLGFGVVTVPIDELEAIVEAGHAKL